MKSFSLFGLSLALLLPVTELRADSENIVELKELKLTVYAKCSNGELQTGPDAKQVFGVKASPLEGSQDSDFSFKFAKKGSQYSIQDDDSVWLEPGDKAKVPVGTFIPSLRDQFHALAADAKSGCSWATYGSVIFDATVKLGDRYKYLVDIREVKKYCKLDFELLSWNFSGERASKVKFLVFDAESNRRVQKSKMESVTRDACTTAVSVAKGTAAVATSIVVAPFILIANLFSLLMGID